MMSLCAQFKRLCTEVHGLRVNILNPRAPHRLCIRTIRGHTACVDCRLSLWSNEQSITTIPHRNWMAHNKRTTAHNTVLYRIAPTV